MNFYKLFTLFDSKPDSASCFPAHPSLQALSPVGRQHGHVPHPPRGHPRQGRAACTERRAEQPRSTRHDAAKPTATACSQPRPKPGWEVSHAPETYGPHPTQLGWETKPGKAPPFSQPAHHPVPITLLINPLPPWAHR